jgi:hypothetical protein
MNKMLVLKALAIAVLTAIFLIALTMGEGEARCVRVGSTVLVSRIQMCCAMF